MSFYVEPRLELYRAAELGDEQAVQSLLSPSNVNQAKNVSNFPVLNVC